jgi:hypothetical protein
VSFVRNARLIIMASGVMETEEVVEIRQAMLF